MSRKQPRKFKHQSAKSGKTPVAKPMSRITKIILIATAAILAMAGIWFFFIYNDGTLPVKGGVVQSDGDNWVIVNHGTTSKPRYYELAEVVPAEGYTRDTSESYKSDKNATDFFLRPDDPQSKIKYCYITGVTKSSQDALSSAMDALGTDYGIKEMSDKVSGTIGTYNAGYFYTKSSSKNEAGETLYLQQLNCYLPIDNNNCIYLNVTVTTDNPNNYLADSLLLQVADTAAKGVTLKNSK